MLFSSRRWVAFAPLAGVAGLLAGCATTPSVTLPPATPAPIQVVAPELSEEQFAPQVVDLLTDGARDVGRLRDVAGAVHHALARARVYFERGLHEQALQTVMGAFFLARTGELHPQTLKGMSDVLVEAAGAAARQGDEGRARAWYELARDSGPGPDATRANEHLTALSQWEQATRADGTMQSVSEQRLAAVKFALIHRSAKSVDFARAAVVKWVERAVETSRSDEPIQSLFDHDERMAARLAFITGAQNMIALYLRDGDAEGAMSALSSDTMSAVTEPRWVTGLIAASEGNPEAWMDWFRRFQTAIEQPELFDPDVARGALWGTAVELFRARPDSIAAALPIASLLIEHGMADAAPLVLLSARDKQPKPDAAPEAAQQVALAERQSMQLLFQALVRLEADDDLSLARRFFANALPLVSKYAPPAGERRSTPAAVDFYELMGELETRAGNLEQAFGYLDHAAGLAPSIETLRLLAAIERQRTRYDASLQVLDALIKLSKSEKLPMASVQALIMSHDVSLEGGKPAEAYAFLKRALEELLALRQHSTTPRVAASLDRVLAEVLERYGQIDAAQRASERAREASVSDGAELTNVLLDEARRALTFGDVAHGRLALRHALDSDLEDSALVYAALWQHLLEIRTKSPSDGTVEEAFSRLDESSGWIGALRDWGIGSLSDEALLERAANPVQQVEARFYAAIRRQFQNRSAESQAALRAVATSPAIELIEVRIARDLTSTGAATGKHPELPQGTVLP